MPSRCGSSARRQSCTSSDASGTKEPETGGGLTILGSGQIVSQLTQAGLIDEYQLVVIPVALGEGRTMFHGVKKQVELQRTGERAFKNGNVLLSYVPR